MNQLWIWPWINQAYTPSLSTCDSHFTITSGSEVNYKMQRLVRNSLCVL